MGTDILSLDEAQEALRSFSSTNEDLVAALNSSVAGQIDDLCGPVVAREVVVTLSGAYSGPLLVTTTPVISVDEVVTIDGTTETTLTADDWQLDNQGHYVRLFRRSGGYDTTWTAGARNVRVTLTAGRFATTADVDAKWKGLAASILRAQWQQEAAAWQQRPQAFDEYENGGLTAYVSVEDMIRRRLPHEMLPPGVA